jgi:hypothetical protein
MKSVFNSPVRDELVERISSLSKESKAQWGKMNVHQMLRHCISWDEVVLGKKVVTRPFLGRLVGKIFLKRFVKDDRPMQQNLPSIPDLKMQKNVDSDITAEKERWISLIKEYALNTENKFVLPFFGQVNEDQAGVVAYKHTDHHLRQFSA